MISGLKSFECILGSEVIGGHQCEKLTVSVNQELEVLWISNFQCETMLQQCNSIEPDETSMLKHNFKTTQCCNTYNNEVYDNYCGGNDDEQDILLQ